VSEREGDLGCQGPLHPCLLQEGKCTIHGFALCALHRLAHVLPLVASRQVCYPSLKAAMEKELAVLVC
jgi:hypothetical protein